MQPLADINVLDLTWHIAGPYATKLLADFGADVLKVERPGLGDPARTYGPFSNDKPHPERSGIFLHLNTNKRSITVNLKNEAGKQIIKELAGWADVVVENFAPGVLNSIDLGYDSLRRVNPGLVMCSISNFGQTGPYRDWKATEFILAAMAGLTFTTGVEGREPLKSADHLQEYQAGAMGALAVMGAVFHQRRGGTGQHIDISIHEVASNSADRRITMLTGYAYTGLISGREPTVATTLPLGAYPCKDGHVWLLVTPTARWPRFMEMVGRPDLVKDPNLHRPEFWGEPEAKDLVDSMLYPWLMERTKQQVMEEAQAARIAGTAGNTTVEVLADRHWHERGYWARADHAEAGSLPYTGPSFRKEGEGWQLKSAAPMLGQHNEEVFTGYLGLSPGELPLLREAGEI